MNLEKIKEIVNAGNINWEFMLLYEISKDEKAIPSIMQILDAERRDNKELIQDLNAMLSKAHLGLEKPQINKGGFMQKEIRDFYKSGRIGHCFANMDKE